MTQDQERVIRPAATLKLRPWPIRIWNGYKFYRQYGGRFWALRTAIKIAFTIGIRT